MILIYPIIYVLGFSAVAISASFALLVAFRFAQVFWLEGVFYGAVQAMFNVVPPRKREQSRTFVVGVANQVGISLAGVMLLLSQQMLQTRDVFLIGLAAALVTIFFTWRARQAYGPAVVAALRAGHAHVFYSEEKPFGGFQQDAVAVSTAVESIHSQDITERRIAAEILGNLSLPEATEAMVDALDDPDATVRAALLRALGRAEATSTLLEIASRLEDSDPEVRLQAVIALRRLAPYPHGLRASLEPLLNDPDSAVRSHVAATLLHLGADGQAEAMLRAMTAGEGNGDITARISALEALTYWGSDEAFELAVMGLEDPAPAVRRASAKAVMHINSEACVVPLTHALGDEDELVRDAAATALGNIGPPAVEMVLAALDKAEMEDGALLALQRLPARRAETKVRSYANDQVAKARHYHGLCLACRSWLAQRAEAVEASGLEGPLATDKWALLADSLWDRAHRHGVRALNALAALGNTTAITLAIENVDSEDAEQRANALETLDEMGQAGIVQPLLDRRRTTPRKMAGCCGPWMMPIAG